MHQYQRLMRRQCETTHTDVERLQLFELLSTAPGVERVEIIEIHPKGGYRVRFDLDSDSIDAFLSVLDAHDWMSVW